MAKWRSGAYDVKIMIPHTPHSIFATSAATSPPSESSGPVNFLSVAASWSRTRREASWRKRRSRSAGIWGIWGIVALGLACSGCLPGGSSSEPDHVWGRHGYSDGRFQKPRAMATDQRGHIYTVDLTARIQVFDEEGRFLRAWQTPTSEFGRPTGLSIDRAGRLMVADTHYYRILFYTPEGELLPDLTIGGTYGGGPGEFGFVTDVVEDSRGNYYIAEYGEFDRIQKFSPDRKFVCQWGQHGSEPGQFLRPQSLVVDEQDQLWVADACNHRIQIFDLRAAEGNAVPPLVTVWGESGDEAGKLNYPYGLLLGPDDTVYVAEYGGHRVQKFTRDGKSLGIWGGPGRKPGQLYQPWSLAWDSRQRLHVLDSLNHRVQRFRF